MSDTIHGDAIKSKQCIFAKNKAVNGNEISFEMSKVSFEIRKFQLTPKISFEMQQKLQKLLTKMKVNIK